MRLQPIPNVPVFGVRNDPNPAGMPQWGAKKTKKKAVEGPAPGSEEWAAKGVHGAQLWLRAKRILEGRQGELKNDMTKADVVRASRYLLSEANWRWPLHTTEAGPTDRIGFVGCVNPFIIYTGGRIGGPLLEAAVTYENTSPDFAAAVLGHDAQGIRLLYHSLAPDTREVSIRPWHLEQGGRYVLRYGPDADDDEVMDELAEECEFEFPQQGTPVEIKVKPRMTYLVEIDQVRRGRAPGPAPDPALTARDLRYSFGRVLARIHNIGSAPVEDVEVAAYLGDPKKGGELIGKATLPNIEAPIDLDPATTTAGFPIELTEEDQKDIWIVVDPDNRITDEITESNNVAHAMLP